MRKILILLLFLLASQSCIMHPRYRRPCVDTPENWRFQADNASTAANYRWWKQFNDPVLDELICTALHYNKDIKVALATVLEFYAKLGIAESQFYPQITGTAVAARAELPVALAPTIPGQPRTFDIYQVLLNMTWELDFWGKIQSMTEVALHQLCSQIQAQREVVLTIVTAVASSYITLRELDKELKISKETFKSRQESLKLARYRYEGGRHLKLKLRRLSQKWEMPKRK